MLNIYKEEVTEFRQLLDAPIRAIELVQDYIVCGNEEAITTFKREI